MAEQTPVARRHEDKWSFDMRALWRLAIWGTTASACLAAAVFAANTDVGAQRLVAMNAPAATPDIITPPPDQPSAAQLAARSAETENETRRLAQAVHALDVEREQLVTRIATLERNLEDVTGSIRAQAAAPAPPNPAPPQPAPVGAQSEPAVPQSEPVGSQSERIATRSAAVGSEVAVPETKPAAKREIGIDVGGAPSFEGLRLLWNATRSVHAPWFEDLHPLASARENPKARGVELRLVVGPFADAEAAAAVCAALTGARRFCQPTPYEGQPFSLAERASKPPMRRPAPAPKAAPAAHP
jgi:hypothetical protein